MSSSLVFIECHLVLLLISAIDYTTSTSDEDEEIHFTPTDDVGILFSIIQFALLLFEEENNNDDRSNGFTEKLIFDNP